MSDRILQGLDSLPDAVRGCVLTAGNFDGVHLGHQRILNTARSLADANNIPAVVMTFEPPPDLVLRPLDAPLRLTPPSEKARLLLAAGADWVVFAKVDRAFLAITPDQFIADILVGCFAPQHMVEGPNFFFGARRAGNIERLAASADSAGFALHVIEPFLLDLGDGESRVSSTRIRSLVTAGLVEDACRCMEREFTFFGRVVSGTGRGGQLLGFPTINLDPGDQVCPADGVYAGRASIAEQTYSAAISIGSNPTLGGVGRIVESHLLDCEGDFAGQDVALQFVKRIGDQQRFDSVDQLRDQIAKDVQRVREILE